MEAYNRAATPPYVRMGMDCGGELNQDCGDNMRFIELLQGNERLIEWQSKNKYASMTIKLKRNADSNDDIEFEVWLKKVPSACNAGRSCGKDWRKDVC